MLVSMTILEMFERFVKPQTNCDIEAGTDLLTQFESLPVRESKEFGFALIESAMILQVMVAHQKRLKIAEEAMKALMSNP
jgi:hypothetical protein